MILLDKSFWKGVLGDSLSPYLFILCAKDISSLIKNLKRKRDFHSVKVCRGSPILVHFLFVDDCFLLCRANDEETKILMDILNTYGKAFGQIINFQKLEVFFFSRSTHLSTRHGISSTLGVSETIGKGKYLGLPSIIGCKKEVFAFIKDRLQRCINNWSTKNLSKVGKKILFKYVVQYIPTCCMSVQTLFGGVQTHMPGKE